MYSNTEKNRAKKEKREILDDRFGFKGPSALVSGV